MPGYSGTALAAKLGIKPGMRLVALAAPKEYRGWLGELPEGARIVARIAEPLEAVHLFVTERAELQRRLTALRAMIEPAGFVWVSWPKKTSKVPTEVTDNVIRDIALPLGFVDIKVCAVSEVWSGLKLVVRKSERGPAKGRS